MLSMTLHTAFFFFFFCPPTLTRILRSCRYSHDAKAYLESKGPDIAEVCPIWDVRGVSKKESDGTKIHEILLWHYFD